jgi:integrase
MSTKRFHRYVRGVGTIRNHSGARTATEFRYRDSLITRLIRLAALDTLRLFKRGALTIADLVGADREGRLEHVAQQVVLHRPLKAAVEAWLETSARAEGSRRRYEVSWNHFSRLKALSDNAVVRELAGVDYHKLLARWGASDADWNRFRAALSAFLSRYLGSKMHPFRYEVLSRVPRGQESEGRVPDFDVADFWRIVDKAYEPVRAVYVAFAALGAGYADLAPLTKHALRKKSFTVLVRGRKLGRQEPLEVAVAPSLWAWVEAAIPLALSDKWLRIWWKRACRAAKVKGVRMYDLRHLSGQLAADAGMADSAVAVHLRHSNASTTRRYTRRVVARQVASAIGEALAR